MWWNYSRTNRIHLLVCDGDKKRRQREAILNKESKRIGFSSAEHESFARATVIILVTQFESKNNSDDSENYGGPSFETLKNMSQNLRKNMNLHRKKISQNLQKNMSQNLRKNMNLLPKNMNHQKRKSIQNQEYHKKVELKTSDLPKMTKSQNLS